MIDTLEFSRTFEAAGFDKKQADALATALGRSAGANREDLATHADLGVVRGDIDALRKDLTGYNDNLRKDIASVDEGLRRGIDSLRKDMTSANEILRKHMTIANDSLRQELKADNALLRRELGGDTELLRKDLEKTELKLEKAIAEAPRTLMIWMTVIGGLVFAALKYL